MVERISGISLANGFVITICTSAVESREKVKVESSLLTVRGRKSQESVALGAPKESTDLHFGCCLCQTQREWEKFPRRCEQGDSHERERQALVLVASTVIKLEQIKFDSKIIIRYYS